jgi:Icc protein
VLLGGPQSHAPINQVHHVAGTAILLCDSTIPGRHDGRLAPETLTWLDETLAGLGDVRSLIAMHHHPVAVHHPLPDDLPLRHHDELAAVIARHPSVAGVLIGHAHLAAASVFAGRPLVVAPSVTWALRLPWEDDQPGDRAQPPGIAFHFLEPGRDLFTRFKTVL